MPLHLSPGKYARFFPRVSRHFHVDKHKCCAPPNYSGTGVSLSEGSHGIGKMPVVNYSQNPIQKFPIRC